MHRFYTDARSSAGPQAGWLQLLFLKVGDRRIATSYGACFDNRLFLFKTGYDPEFATGAPFKILTSFAIRKAYAQGLDRSRLPRRRRALEARMDVDQPRTRLAVRLQRHDASPALAFHQVPVATGVEAMASVTGTFVPTYQGLSAVDFVRPAPAARAACFPFNVAGPAALLPRPQRHLSPVHGAGRADTRG